MHQHAEQEWQFAASALDGARRWLASQPRSSSERRFAAQPALELRDTYYDSPDWMIFRAGYALRLRHARAADAGAGTTEVTLKTLNGARGGFARRREFSENVDAVDMNAVLERADGIGERIRELVGTRVLAPLFHAHTRRERQHLLEAGTDLPLAEVDLDETSIETPSGGVERQLLRVEVECLNAEPLALAPWVEQLRAAAHLHPVEASKFRTGLSVAGLDPAGALVAGALEISAAQAFDATQLAMLRRFFMVVLEKEPLARAGSATAVHEMRVAARHLHVLLRMFTGYGPRWAVGSRAAVRRIVKALGDVRDCDVQLAYLDEARVGLVATEQSAIEPLRVQLQLQRRKARVRMLRNLDSVQTRAWIDKWREHLGAGTRGSVRAQRAATGRVALALIRAQARKLRKRADRLTFESGADDYHEVRIHAKRLRYTLGAFESLYGEPAQSFTRALARLQNVLGACHDASVRAAAFTALVSRARRLPATTSFVTGRLVERDANAAAECRDKFPKAYRRVRRRRWRALVAEMERVAQLPRAPAAATGAR